MTAIEKREPAGVPGIVQEQATVSQTLRLCTWNIQLGLQIGTVLREIQAHADFHGLDLIALQEASVHETGDDARLIAKALGPSYESYQVTADSFAGRPQANALIWNRERVRVKHKDSVKLPKRDQVLLPRFERTLLRTLHAPQRISLVVEAEFGAETMRIYVAHLDVIGFEHKREQLSCILRDAQARDPVDLAILAGDLNTFRIRSRPSWQSLAAAAENAGFSDITTEIRWTHEVRRLNLRQKLDAIFVGRLRPFHYRSWTLEIPGSDHIPVFAEITLE